MIDDLVIEKTLPALRNFSSFLKSNNHPITQSSIFLHSSIIPNVMKSSRSRSYSTFFPTTSDASLGLKPR